MPGAFLTIAGMYNYDNTIFENFQVPESMDRDLAINSILLDCGNRGLLYVDFDFMRLMIGVWSQRNQRGWARAAAAVAAEYNPLHNYDRTEEWTDEGESESEGSGTSSSSGSNTNKSTAFDSYTGRETDSSEGSSEGSSSDRGTSSGRSEHHGRMYGNIGVTTSQQMLEAELDLSSKLDVYKRISDDFAMQFCYAW